MTQREEAAVATTAVSVEPKHHPAKTSKKPANAAKNTTETDRDRPQNPAYLAYESKRAACDNRITQIRAEIDAIINGYSFGGAGLNEKDRNKRGELIEQVKALRTQIKGKDDERRTLNAQFGETLEALRRKNADSSSQREKLSFRSAGDIDKRIAEIEKSLEEARFTLSEERQMLQEVSKLKKMRKALESMDSDAASNVAGLRLRLDQVKARQGDLDTDLNQLRSQLAELSAAIDALNGERAVADAKRADSQGQLDRLRRDLNTEFTKKNAAWAEFQEARAAREASYLRMVARREEDARKAALEADIDELESRLGKLGSESIIDRKWNECTTVLNYFGSTDKAHLETAAATVGGAKNLRKLEGIDLSRVQVIRKADEDEISYFKKPANKNKQHAQNSIVAGDLDFNKLPFHVLGALADLSLELPRSPADLPQLLATLQERRSDLQEHRDASQAALEAQRAHLLEQIEALRLKIDAKEEQITASAIKKAEKAKIGEEADLAADSTDLAAEAEAEAEAEAAEAQQSEQ